MLDIFGMCQVLFPCVLVVKALKMMDLVLVLVVAVMSWPETQIRKREPLCDADGVFGEGDGVTPVPVEEFYYAFDGGVLVGLRDVFGGDVLEAVGFGEVVRSPGVAAVVVVEVEEGARVEGGDVVLFYHVSGCPVCVGGYNELLVVVALRQHEGEKGS